MNKEAFNEFLNELQEKYYEDYIYELAEESNLLEDNSSYDGDWTNDVEKIYRYNNDGLNFVFKHSYSEHTGGNCCDKWNVEVVLLENYDNASNKKADIIYTKVEESLKNNLSPDNDYSFLKDVIKDVLKDIN